MSTEPEADETSWKCPCGEEWYFDDRPPESGADLECDTCGAVHVIEAVDWHATVYFKEKKP